MHVKPLLFNLVYSPSSALIIMMLRISALSPYSLILLSDIRSHMSFSSYVSLVSVVRNSFVFLQLELRDFFHVILERLGL